MLDNEKAARNKRISRVIMWVILLALFTFRRYHYADLLRS